MVNKQVLAQFCKGFVLTSTLVEAFVKKDFQKIRPDMCWENVFSQQQNILNETWFLLVMLGTPPRKEYLDINLKSLLTHSGMSFRQTEALTDHKNCK